MIEMWRETNSLEVLIAMSDDELRTLQCILRKYNLVFNEERREQYVISKIVAGP